MDCGPAALKCLCAGFGIEVGYDRLREACQTGLDGTSINTLEAVAVHLGLAAEQVMLPADHFLLPAAAALPALLVVTNTLGVTHFLIVWRRLGGWVQVMDPAAGRRWMPARRLLAETYVHAMPVPAAAWREWAGSAELTGVLAARMKAIGIPASVARSLLAAALADPGWRPLAALDAALRMTAALVDAGGLRAGGEAAGLLRGLMAADPADPGAIPEIYWSVVPEAGGHLRLRGAVLVRVKGRRATAGAGEETLPAELRAADAEPASRPGRELAAAAAEDGRLTALALAAASSRARRPRWSRRCSSVPCWTSPAAWGCGSSGRRPPPSSSSSWSSCSSSNGRRRRGCSPRGAASRSACACASRAKIARLGDRYFRSRLSSDMAERCHSSHRLRTLPELAASFLRSGWQLLFTAAGIAWLDPGVAPLAALSALLAFALPMASQPLLLERDLRVRNHAGALGRFYLDALLGLVPARNHGAERALRREHEGLLIEWARSALRLESVSVLLDALQSDAPATGSRSGSCSAIWRAPAIPRASCC